MYPVVNYTFTRPEQFHALGVTISPTGEPAPYEKDGDINLFEQASQIFGQLSASNVFTAQFNTFQGQAPGLPRTSLCAACTCTPIQS